MSREQRQLELFSLPAPKPVELEPLDFSAEREIAERLPGHVRFGTSSWTFPGWAGLVYPRGVGERTLIERGLELYVKHPLLTTVGIDRSYYAPLDAPALARYAEQLPVGFRCVMKVWNELTSAVHPRSREPNPRFFDAALFEREVLSPVLSSFGDHAGPLVFEIMPLARRELPSAQEFAARLDRFLGRLSREASYAVELRNAELFSPAYLEVLARHRVGHVLSFWERMPEIGEQLRAPGVLTSDVVVCRLLIPPGRSYEARKRELAPFDQIVDAQPGMRDDVAALARACELLGKVLLVIVNNKAEGSSPLTVRALAERIARPERS